MPHHLNFRMRVDKNGPAGDYSALAGQALPPLPLPLLPLQLLF
jgi:hypothetical protein